MDDTRSPDIATASDTIAPEGDRQLDDLDELDADRDCFEPLNELDAPDGLERLGGYSESTASEDPPPE